MENLKVFNTTNSSPSGANIISCMWVLKYKKKKKTPMGIS